MGYTYTIGDGKNEFYKRTKNRHYTYNYFHNKYNQQFYPIS